MASAKHSQQASLITMFEKQANPQSKRKLSQVSPYQKIPNILRIPQPILNQTRISYGLNEIPLSPHLQQTSPHASTKVAEDFWQEQTINNHIITSVNSPESSDKKATPQVVTVPEQVSIKHKKLSSQRQSSPTFSQLPIDAKQIPMTRQSM